MRVRVTQTMPNMTTMLRRVGRLEIPVEAMPAGYTVILLDADDTFDVIIEDDNGAREIIWSAVKEAEL